MKNVTGFYPHLRVDTSRVSAVGQAGGVLLTETIRTSGLDVALSEALGRWRKPTAVYDPARIVSDLALTLALGGDCLADIAPAEHAESSVQAELQHPARGNPPSETTPRTPCHTPMPQSDHHSASSAVIMINKPAKKDPG